MKLLMPWNSDRAVLSRANKARDARDWGAAAAYYQNFLARHSDATAIWIQYGHALKEGGRFTDAYAAYCRAVSLEPENSDAHLQLGHLQKITGRSVEARESYNRAFQIDGNPDAARELESFATDSRLVHAVSATATAAGNPDEFIKRFAEQIDYVTTHVATVKALSFEVAQIKKFLPLHVSPSPYETMRTTAAALVAQLDSLAVSQAPTEYTLTEIDLLIERLEAIRRRRDDAL